MSACHPLRGAAPPVRYAVSEPSGRPTANRSPSGAAATTGGGRYLSPGRTAGDNRTTFPVRSIHATDWFSPTRSTEPSFSARTSTLRSPPKAPTAKDAGEPTGQPLRTDQTTAPSEPSAATSLDPSGLTA